MNSEIRCLDCIPEVVEQCIERMPLSPGAKRLLRKAFEEGKVTPLMERHMQQACPHLEQEPEIGQSEQRGLLHRARRIAGSSDTPTEEPQDLMEDSPTLLMDSREIQAMLRKQREAGANAKPPPAKIVPTAPILEVPETGHRILLPAEGSLTLGCLDSLSRISPDVDLTHDDQQHSVAFLHARITARDGKHFIEDFGSLTGTWINDKRLEPKQEHVMQQGDRVRLGSCEMLMTTAPPHWSEPSLVYRLYATASGRTFSMPCAGEVTLGRADPRLGFAPDINLNEEGDVALLVSRRHAAVRCYEGRLEVTDLESSNGTKVDGIPISRDTWVPLKPGQHLWLGGFCMAVDVETA